MSSDIYGMQEPPVSNRKKRSAISQRRDEYLRARGEEAVPHHQHHSRKKHHRSLKQKVALVGLGVLTLLTALIIIGSVLLAIHAGPVDKEPTANGPTVNGRDVILQ